MSQAMRDERMTRDYPSATDTPEATAGFLARDGSSVSGESFMLKASDGQRLVQQSPEEAAAVKKEANKAKRTVKRARRAAARQAEEDRLAARKAARKKAAEELRISIVDGNVVDKQGNIIRKYSRGERFFDNKPLALSVAVGIIIFSLVGFLYFFSLNT
jgi:hypothetical protein